jgi:raffinose/stachyose/melibiose transport system substrate-binding protein
VKKRVVLLAVLFVVFSIPFVWSEGKQEANSGDTITLKLFHRFPEANYSAFIDQVIKEYETSHPNVHIEVVSAANAPYKEKLKVVLGSEQGPDIFFGWVGDFSNRFIRENLVLDLTPYYEGDSQWQNYMITSLVEPFYYKEKLYGMPFRVSGKAFYYNKALFNKYGITIPKTYKELIAVCKAFKAKGITPIAYGNQELWPSSHYIGTLNQKVVDNETRLRDYNPETGSFTDPGYVRALELYQELMQYVNDYPNGLSHEMARQSFANQETAMMYMETIEVNYLEDAMTTPFEYGMFPFPAVIDGNGDQGYITGAPEGFWCSSKTKYPDEAVAFLKYLTGPEVGKKQIREIRWFNGTKGQIDGVFTDEPIRDAYNMILNASGLAYWLDNDLHAKLVDRYLTGVSELTNGDITPEALMKDIQDLAKIVRSEF